MDLIINPAGVEGDQYPGFAVHFDMVPGYRSYYEGMEPESLLTLAAPGSKCSFIIEDSVWMSEFHHQKGYIESSFARPFEELKHFVVLGGDHVVEVLSYEPRIERIDGPRLIREIRV